MSIEIYGSRHRNGASVGIGVSMLEDAFIGLVAQLEPGALMLSLQHSGGVLTPLFFKAEDGQVASFTVVRPVDDPRLYEALFRIVLLEGVVLYAPGSPPIFGHPNSASHLPTDMTEALGAGALVSSASDLRGALFSE
jgi:hypothetical protein